MFDGPDNSASSDTGQQHLWTSTWSKVALKLAPRLTDAAVTGRRRKKGNVVTSLKLSSTTQDRSSGLYPP